MAQAAQQPHPMSLDAFLAWEERQDTRHELQDGQVVAMAGGTAAHNLIIQNIAAALRSGLRGQGGGCGTFTENIKVLSLSGNATYPDVVVDCGQWSLTDTVAASPTLIVEVLSDTTESADRGRKWFGYQHIATLRHYLLVAQDAPSVELYSRDEGGSWRYRHVEGLSAVVELEAVSLVLPLAEVFRDARAGVANVG